MKTIAGINQPLTGIGQNTPAEKGDPKAVAREAETVFLNEFLKIMMDQTTFGKDKTISNYMPFITTEVAKSIAERGIGIGDLIIKNQENKDRAAEVDDNSAIKTPKGDSPSKGSQHGRTKNISEWDGQLRFPVSGRIASGYGMRRDPIDGMQRHHDGMDIAVPEGTPVMPAAPGKVVFSGYSGGYGNCVIIDHGNGMTSLYAHNSANQVKTGDVVDANRIIALSGATGRSTGPHLHFEMRNRGIPFDPAGMIS